MTHNQRRAAERNVQTAREILVACNVQPQFVPTVVSAIAAGMDEAEARGRAEVSAKLEALANEFDGDYEIHAEEVARLIRALVDEVTR